LTGTAAVSLRPRCATYHTIHTVRVADGEGGTLLDLMGYTRDDGIRLVYLEAVGPHENFYRDLKR